LDEYHLFTTVAEEFNHPYHTAEGTNVDLAITNESMLAQICHYAMVHTADSLYCAANHSATKKQYGLKVGLRKFADHGNAAVVKKLTQFHTLKCFKPCDPSTVLRIDRRNALTLLMFLTEKCQER
jgi:hypothetical protein